MWGWFCIHGQVQDVGNKLISGFIFQFLYSYLIIIHFISIPSRGYCSVGMQIWRSTEFPNQLLFNLLLGYLLCPTWCLKNLQTCKLSALLDVCLMDVYLCCWMFELLSIYHEVYCLYIFPPRYVDPLLKCHV